jgi:hypothetical protein
MRHFTNRWNGKQIAGAVLAVLLCVELASSYARLLVPVDVPLRNEIQMNIRAAQAEGDYGRVLRESRRLLEFYPNEPAVRAPMYMAMAEAADKSGDSAHAAEYRAVALAIDPGIAGRLQPGAKMESTRGAAGDTIMQAFTVAMQTAAAIQQARLAAKQNAMMQPQPGMPGGMQPGMAMPGQPGMAMAAQPGMAMPAQPGMAMPAQPGMAMPAQPMMPAQPGMPPQPAMPAMPAQPAMAMPDATQAQPIVYPAAPVGASGYQPPAAGYQPPPAYDPNVYAQAAAVQPMPAPQAMPAQPAMAAAPPINGVTPMYQPPAQQQMPPAQPGYPQQGIPAPPQSRQAPAYPPMVQPQANAQSYPQQQGAPQQQTYPQQQSYPQQQGNPQQARMSAPRPPYQAPPTYRPGRTRGDAFAPVRVVYDRSVTTDAAYFERACGALVGVEDNNLTFTTSCGETPYVIPASEILEIRLNLAVGRDAGVFHIATRGGLYLQLALESASRDEAAALIDSLRKHLGLAE